ncbi:extracellular serine/threonine protein kinase FAM20C-like [Acanthaster planci]|uniref:Extracellular serine/threonine protein kinase FAM20C-like n=1 Tax=Acanthaster planci TaxID=133434 RepID=A0A8B7XLK2_ACAPL|nr:extracellular serine/threonine protein kinase FAM20C-like [Acanthaster planci]
MRFKSRVILLSSVLTAVSFLSAFRLFRRSEELSRWALGNDNRRGVSQGNRIRPAGSDGGKSTNAHGPCLLADGMKHVFNETKDRPKNSKKETEKKSKQQKGWDDQEVIGAGHPWQQFCRDINQDALYSEDAQYMDDLLRDLATVKIVNASQFSGGTQLKLDLRLADGNRVIAKPMRLPRDYVYKYDHEEPFWLDPERHNAEIASFHLDRLLGFRRVPPCSGRHVNLKEEILKMTDDTNLLSTVFKNSKHWKLSRFSRRWKEENICLDLLKDPVWLEGRYLLDLIEQGIFDFFLRNYDRHHYTQLRQYRKSSCVIHVDNGKGFGNPLVDDDTFLAPVYQCCKLRRSTYLRLKELARPKSRLGHLLKSSMSRDPIAPVVTEDHMRAMDRRLQTVLNTINKCIHDHGERNVLVERLD